MSLNYLLVFVALVLIGVLVIFLLGLRRRERLAEQDLAEQELLQELGQAPGAELPAAQAPSSRRRVMDHPFLDEELAPPLPNLPPVLLPERPGPKDVAKVRFSLGLRGYRMDQVDQVLD
ncbi:DivIVA domain-containing protein, partial [Acaricomes phytoseiuli]